MDNSTENVTIYAVFINDLLSNYEKENEEYKELFDIVADCDLSNPTNPIPMTVHIAISAWIEENLGKFNLTRAGKKIGGTAYGQLVEQGMISSESRPLEIVEAIIKLCEIVIVDEKNRSYEVLEATSNCIMLRRTQTFNGKLQLGVLDGILRASGLRGLNVTFAEEVDKGAEYDVYKITWL